MRIAIFLFTVAGAAANAQTIEFKGLPLGAPKATLLAKFPSLECRTVSPSFSSLGEEHCTDSPCYSAACSESRSLLGTYAGMPAWNHSFGIVAGKVERFSVNFHARNYETVRDALRQVYPRGTERSGEIQTRMGATLASRTWAADADGAIVVSEHEGVVTEGAVGAASTAFTLWRAAKSKGDAKKNSKDL